MALLGDQPSIFGPHVPPEVSRMISVVNKTPLKAVQGLLGHVIEYAKGMDATGDMMDAWAEEGKLPRATTASLFTCLWMIVRGVIRTHARTEKKQEVIQAQLQELGLSGEVAGELARVIQLRRIDLEGSAFDQKLHFPSLEGLSWRVDVTMTTTHLSHVMKPTLLMELRSSDGVVRTFDVSVQKFHELRFHTAKLLKELEEVEANPILKITDK